jgi:hypothetical protein
MFTYSPTRAYSLTMFTYVPTRAYSRSHLLTNLAIALQPIGRRQRGLLTTYYLLLTTYYLLLTTYYLLLTTYYLQPIGRRQGPTRFLPRTHSGEAGLQPYVEEAATACAGGCSRTW